MPTWPQPSLSSGFTYVQDTQPNGPAEGETWYDLGGNEAKVYDGAQWHLLTVTSHSEVGGVQAGQHRSDANVRSTVDGEVDADTVDGQHASDLGASFSNAGTFPGSASASSSQGYNTAVGGTYTAYVQNPHISAVTGGATLSTSTGWSGHSAIEMGVKYIDGSFNTVWSGRSRNKTVTASWPAAYVEEAYVVYEKEQSSSSSHSFSIEISDIEGLLVS